MYKVSTSLSSKQIEQINPFKMRNGKTHSNPGISFKSLDQDIFELTAKNEKAKNEKKPETLGLKLNNMMQSLRNSAGDVLTSTTDFVLDSVKYAKEARYKTLTDELLIDLESEKKSNILTAVALLGKLNAKEGIERMTEMLKKNSTDIEIAAGIINALSKLKNASGVQPVIDILEDPEKDERLRTMAAISLGRMKNRKASKPLFDILRDQNESEMLRSHAAFALSAFPTIRNTEQLTKALSDPSEQVRAQAALSLGILGNKDSVNELVKLLKDPDSQVKRNAALALGDLKATSSVDDLIFALEDTNEKVVVTISKALNRINASDTEEKLVDILENNQNSIVLRRNAAACLYTLVDHEHSADRLNAILSTKDEDLILRNNVLSVLIQMRSANSIGNIVNILKDSSENFQLKINAAAGVGLIGHDSEINLLLNKINETQMADLKYNCMNAVRSIIARTQDKSKIKPEKIMPFLNDDNEKVAALAANSLGTLKAQVAVDKLSQIAIDEDRPAIVRAYSIAALGKIGDKKVEKTLLDILRNDSNHIISSNAAAALYTLGSKKVLFNIINSPDESYKIKNHAAGVLISRGEKDPKLNDFLKPGLNVRKLHENDIKGQGIEVAVIDDSVDADHPEFDGRIILEPLDHHGTLVSGNLGGNLSGVAPKVIIHTYNAFKDKDVDQILEKIVDQKINGDNDIKVVNISLGFNPKLMSDPRVQNTIKRFDHVATMAKKLGITVVVASGNDGRDIPVPGLGTMNLLCLSDSVISVGATVVNGSPDDAKDDTRADFSGYPDETTPRKLDVMAPGFEITLPYAGGSYKTVDGTSFSAPFVAGLVALMYQVNPEIKPDKVKEILKDTAVKLGEVPDNMQGAGEVTPISAVIRALKMADPKMADKLSEKLDPKEQKQMTIFFDTEKKAFRMTA